MDRPVSSEQSSASTAKGVHSKKNNLFETKIIDLLKAHRATAVFSSFGDDDISEIASTTTTTAPDHPNPSSDLNTNANNNASPATAAATTMSCRSCAIVFRAVEEQHAHYKSSWHCFNLKRKLSGLAPISQVDYNDLGDAGELSSDSESGKEDDGGGAPLVTREEGSSDEETGHSSGDDSAAEEEDEQTTLQRTGKPLLHRATHLTFVLTPSAGVSASGSSTQCVTLFRAVLGHMHISSTAEEAKQFYLRKFSELSSNHVWVFFMCSGGHFAGAVFDKLKILHHKTIHRYTTRRKQGGTQSSRDNRSAGSGPQSAGAMIRRRNEKKLHEEIVALLTEWKDHLKRASIIWLAAPGNNKYIFIRDNPILSKDDERIRSIPLVTSRPTLVEIQRVHSILSSVQLTSYSTEEILRIQKQKEEEAEKESAAVAKEAIAASPAVVTATPEEIDLLLEAAKIADTEAVKRLLQEKYVRPIPNDAMKISSPLYEACTRGHQEIVTLLLKNNKELNLTIPSDRFRTAIIAAASAGHEEIVSLLLDAGADPTIKGIDSKNAYAAAGENKKIQKCISRFAVEHPNAFDWNRANIPQLTAEQDREREKAKAEKLKQKRKNQKEKQKQRKVEEEKQKKEQEEKEKAARELREVETARKLKESQLTERERRALAAEARLKPSSSASGRVCDHCKQTLPLVPFERFEYKYCSTKCVQAHKAVIGK